MIEPAYHFCPRCGGPLEIQDNHGEQRQICSQCHKTLYKNQNVCVVCIILRDGTMLFTRRAVEPFKSKLDIPGGFVNADEGAPQAAVREVKEELGIESIVVKLLGYYGPAHYPFEGVDHYNGDLVYLMESTGEPTAHDDAASIEWFPLDQLPYGQTAFASQNAFLEDVRIGKVRLI